MALAVLVAGPVTQAFLASLATLVFQVGLVIAVFPVTLVILVSAVIAVFQATLALVVSQAILGTQATPAFPVIVV